MTSDPDHVDSDHVHACRICYEPDNLVSVCKCTGTVEYVHFECLQKWISVSGATHCELCGSEYTDFSEPDTCLDSDVNLVGIHVIYCCLLCGLLAYFFFRS
jgi:hypothetical protein